MSSTDELLKEICENGLKVLTFNNESQELKTLLMHGLVEKSDGTGVYTHYSATDKGREVCYNGGFTKWSASSTADERIKQLQEELYSLGVSSLRDLRDNEKNNRIRSYLAVAAAWVAALAALFPYLRSLL